MLKITTTDSSEERRWALQGRLAGQWTSELKSRWREAGRVGEGITVQGTKILIARGIWGPHGPDVSSNGTAGQRVVKLIDIALKTPCNAWIRRELRATASVVVFVRLSMFQAGRAATRGLSESGG
jgi:hypothetical protein